MRHRSEARRWGVALVTGLLVIGAVVPTSAQAQTAARDIRKFACPPELIDAAFTDIEGNTHELAITCLAAYDITLGTSGTRYSPSQFVRRGQMATFLYRLLEFQGVPMDLADQGFTDVAGHPHELSINGIASIGVARGRTTTRFAPQELITRGEMATFLTRVAALFGPPLPTGPDAFDDDNASTHQAAINAVAAAGIAQGTGNRRFDPDGAVTRAAMAAFISRLLDWGVEENVMVTFSGEDVALAALSPNEATGGGVTGASGSVWLATIGQDDVLCYELMVDDADVSGATAHLHKGGVGVDTDPPVLTFSAPLAPNPAFPIADAMARRCMEADPALISDVVANPTLYYVDIHTTAAPNGALRGQLGKLDTALVAELVGDEVVTAPGDPDAFGLAVLLTTTQPDDLCYYMLVFGTAAPTSAAVHRGTMGTEGPVEITLKTPQETPIPETFVSIGCQGGVNAATISAMKANPAAYYISFSDAVYPAGSVRGQLQGQSLQTRAAAVR